MSRETFVLVLVLGIVLAALTIVFNIFGWQNIHAFIKSVYESASKGEADYKCCKTARNWLRAFGIMDATFALTSAFPFDIFGLIIAIIPAVVQFMAASLIDKYFIKDYNPPKIFYSDII